MKIAVSIPDEVFKEADRLAKRLHMSRNEVYSRALAEYIVRHGINHATESMDKALLGGHPKPANGGHLKTGQR